MLPAGKCPGHFTAVIKEPPGNFPDMFDVRKDALFVGEQDRNAACPGIQLSADLFFPGTIERGKRFVKQEEVIFTGKDTGEVQALEFSPAQRKDWCIFLYLDPGMV
jgi:hypothetical protein